MKKKSKSIITISIFFIIISYVFLTPIGALRFAVLREGYPIEAITLKVDYSSAREPSPLDMDIKNNIVYTIFNAPIEEPTQTPLDNWVISKYGIFYWCEMYFY